MSTSALTNSRLHFAGVTYVNRPLRYKTYILTISQSFHPIKPPSPCLEYLRQHQESPLLRRWIRLDLLDPFGALLGSFRKATRKRGDRRGRNRLVAVAASALSTFSHSFWRGTAASTSPWRLWHI